MSGIDKKKNGGELRLKKSQSRFLNRAHNLFLSKDSCDVTDSRKLGTCLKIALDFMKMLALPRSCEKWPLSHSLVECECDAFLFQELPALTSKSFLKVS